MKLFDTKYPLIAVAMNKVSKVDLAIACANAGILGSISGYNYGKREYDPETNTYPFKIDYDRVEFALSKFNRAVGNTNLIFSAPGFLFNDERVLSLLLSFKVPYIEIYDSEILSVQTLKKLKDLGLKIIFKFALGHYDSSRHPDEYLSSLMPYVDYIDCIIFKSDAGAGNRTTSTDSVEDMFIKFKKQYPNTALVPSGGIATREQIHRLLDMGATAVGMGTVFAMSAESLVDPAVKNALLSKTDNDISVIASPFVNRPLQNAIVFDNQEKSPDWDMNNTTRLMKGVKSPDEGLIFIGKGISHINEILTCEQIVQKFFG